MLVYHTTAASTVSRKKLSSLAVWWGVEIFKGHSSMEIHIEAMFQWLFESRISYSMEKVMQFSKVVEVSSERCNNVDNLIRRLTELKVSRDWWDHCIEVNNIKPGEEPEEKPRKEPRKEPVVIAGELGMGNISANCWDDIVGVGTCQKSFDQSLYICIHSVDLKTLNLNTIIQ